MKSFKDRIDNYRNIINDRLNHVVIKDSPVSFYEPVRYILEGGGKRIRPILVILACKAVGGKQDDCLDAAVAVEILHNFTLVHDDIMDNDDLRRSRQTVHKKWDEATAILAGDGLVALAYHYLLKTNSQHIKEIAEIFTAGIVDLCEGQALDKEFESRYDIDLNQYMSMIEKKTARLLMISSEIGAIIGGGDYDARGILSEFSRQLGCAFQIQDDLLDIETTSGKTFGSDIKQKKMTILFVHALNHAHPKVRNQLLNIIHRSEITDEDVLKVRDLFSANGTMKFARQEIDSRLNKAQQVLNQLAPSESRNDLSMLLNWILERKS
ncbi:MAG: polyprenyl synthetase family protein [bacterium]|nr:MAG: polyprenyl synthetase family protein [bacterium]